MNNILTSVLIGLIIIGCGSDNIEEKNEPSVDSPVEEREHSAILNFQAELNEYYLDTAHTPLLPDDYENFEALEFFEIDHSFSLEADFVRIESEPFGMQTSTDRLPIYEIYGEAHFELKGVACVLTLFESHKSREDSVWKHYLFLPYKDLTSGNDSYGGGRFIDVLMPKEGKVTIDFNQSYNPLCAYNHKYSCPIPPEENYLEVRVEAGVKAWEEH